MPVTGKLSKQFYDRLGDEVADELVNWLNAVDAAYRNDLRELNEHNFARFDAVMGQRFAEFQAVVDRRFAQTHAIMDRRFAESHAETERRFAETNAGVAELRAEIATKASAIEMERRFVQLETRMERALKEQTRWMFVAWATLLIPIIGLWMRP